MNSLTGRLYSCGYCCNFVYKTPGLLKGKKQHFFCSQLCHQLSQKKGLLLFAVSAIQNLRLEDTDDEFRSNKIRSSGA